MPMTFSDMPDNDPPTTEAQFDSNCPWCGERIHEGDTIAKNDSDEWVHEECV
jgi:hypothetical protein